MSNDYDGVYVPTEDEDTFESTPLANAGWYEEGQHGGALAALIVGRIGSVPTLTPMQVARVTVEIFRVVPLVPLTVRPTVVREGKRIQTIQVDVTDPNGTLLSMGIIQRLRIADRELPREAATESTGLSEPGESRITDSRTWGIGDTRKKMFHRDAIEIREIEGGFGSIGPGAVWVRTRIPIIAGRANTPAQRTVIAGDFCNGVSRKLGLDDWVFMNSDLTVHIGRYPTGEWVGLDARSSYSNDGRGVASGSLWDTEHWVGQSAQTLYVDTR
jgi:hypothetical protein